MSCSPSIPLSFMPYVTLTPEAIGGMISPAEGNALVLSPDGKLFVPEAADSAPAKARIVYDNATGTVNSEGAVQPVSGALSFENPSILVAPTAPYTWVLFEQRNGGRLDPDTFQHIPNDTPAPYVILPEPTEPDQRLAISVSTSDPFFSRPVGGQLHNTESPWRIQNTSTGEVPWYAFEPMFVLNGFPSNALGLRTSQAFGAHPSLLPGDTIVFRSALSSRSGGAPVGVDALVWVVESSTRDLESARQDEIIAAALRDASDDREQLTRDIQANSFAAAYARPYPGADMIASEYGEWWAAFTQHVGTGIRFDRLVGEIVTIDTRGGHGVQNVVLEAEDYSVVRGDTGRNLKQSLRRDDRNSPYLSVDSSGQMFGIKVQLDQQGGGMRLADPSSAPLSAVRLVLLSREPENRPEWDHTIMWAGPGIVLTPGSPVTISVPGATNTVPPVTDTLWHLYEVWLTDDNTLHLAVDGVEHVITSTESLGAAVITDIFNRQASGARSSGTYAHAFALIPALTAGDVISTMREQLIRKANELNATI